jgi:hypothetical protein
MTSLVHAGFAGFKTGEMSSGFTLTGEVASVNLNLDKSYSLPLGPRLRVGVVEIGITSTNGTTKRTALAYMGRHSIRAPVSIEFVGIVALLCMAGLALYFGHFLRSVFGARRAEPDAAHEPPSAAAVREASETMNAQPEGATPADGGGR